MQINHLMQCQNLADEISHKIKISPSLYRAFCGVNRAKFAPLSAHAFSLDAQPIGENQWLSSPLSVAVSTMALKIDKDVDNILEIGCGSGYQAAILSKMVRRVFTIERIERLANEAKKRFEDLKISNIKVRFDDGNVGWRDFAPYDRILLSAAAKRIDERLFAQLKDGGILVAPMQKNGFQEIVRFHKNGRFIQEESVERCEFVPLLDGTKRI